MITIGDNQEEKISSNIVNKYPFHSGATHGFTDKTRFHSAFNLYRQPHASGYKTSLFTSKSDGEGPVANISKNDNCHKSEESLSRTKGSKLCLSCLLSQSEQTSTYSTNFSISGRSYWKSLGARFYYGKPNLVSCLLGFSGTQSMNCTSNNFNK